MRYKVFDVVELKNGNKAIIKKILKHRRYVVHIISKMGEDLGIKVINKKDIRQDIFVRNNM